VEIYPGAANQETVSVPPATAETPKAQEIKSKAPKRLFIIKHLRIKEGKFAFVDYNISEHGYKVVIEDINLAASRVSFSILPAKTHFAGKAKIFASDQNKATVALKGWINLFKKDLDAKLNLTNLDLGIFSPYLSSKDNPQIKGGILNAEADLKAKNNKLTATASLNLKGFLYKEPTEKETSSASVLQPMLFGMLETSDGHPQKFTIEGKLLPFTVEKVNFDVFIAKDKLKDVFSSAPEGIQDASKIFEEKPKEATPEVAPPIGEAAPEVNAEIPAANAEIPQPPDANVETPTVVQ
jgi:hypothetical protein